MDLNKEVGKRKMFYLRKLAEYSVEDLSGMLNTIRGNSYKAFSCQRCSICLKHREVLENALNKMKGGKENDRTSN